jgi:ferrous iron transport protein A
LCDITNNVRRLKHFMNMKIKKTPLGSHDAGEKLTVVSLEGGDLFKEKLICQGIIPGAEIEIINKRKNGPLVVKINKTKVIIGSGMTDKIFVKE